jgi:hypothetical protein
MRWIVGKETPAISASWRWSIPSMARAARICAAVIMSRLASLELQPKYIAHPN